MALSLNRLSQKHIAFADMTDTKSQVTTSSEVTPTAQRPLEPLTE